MLQLCEIHSNLGIVSAIHEYESRDSHALTEARLQLLVADILNMCCNETNTMG